MAKKEFYVCYLPNIELFTKWCAGGDLDGDFYTVIWDKELIPPRTCDPAEYPKPRVKQKKVLEYPKDVANFFVDYMALDVIGLIDTSWRACAELNGLDASIGKCRELAALHAIAIDFAKTGNVQIRKLYISKEISS